MPNPFQVTDSSPLLEKGVDCIYCHTDIVLNDQVVLCSECDSPHHVECWQTNENRCATFGCDAAEAVGSTRRTRTNRTNRTTQTNRARVRSTIFTRPSPARSRSASPPEFTLISNASNTRFTCLMRGLIAGLILFAGWVWLVPNLPQQEQIVRQSPSPTVDAWVRVEPTRPVESISAIPSAVLSYKLPNADFDDTTGAISGLIRIRDNDGTIHTLVNARIGLSSELDAGAGEYSAYSRSDSPQATIGRSGIFVFNRLDPGRYILILDAGATQFIMNRPDRSGEFTVYVQAGKQVDLGVLEYERVAYPGLGIE